MLSYFWPTVEKPCPEAMTVSVAESVTAGALANSLCSEPGASSYFKGGIVAYSILSKKEILGIDTDYAEANNFANPFTTLEMAKSVAKMFNSRVGMATTGYSLPCYRPANKERNECELNITHPYAYITLYDRFTNHEITIREDFKYSARDNDTIQRAMIQSKISLIATTMYKKYVDKILSSAK
jgi:PncC family amidohydrolase